MIHHRKLKRKPSRHRTNENSLRLFIDMTRTRFWYNHLHHWNISPVCNCWKQLRCSLSRIIYLMNQYIIKTYGILQLSHLSTIDYQIVTDYVILCEIKRRTYPIWSFSFNHVHAPMFWKQTRKLTHIVCAWYLVIWLIIFFADRQLL